MATIHANSAGDSLVRLEALALLAAPALSIHAVRKQVASALEVVVHLVREPSGLRRIAEVVDVPPAES